MFWVVDSLTMRKYKLMKCLDDSCDSAVEKVNVDESQVRRLQVFVYLDDRNSPASPYQNKSICQYTRLKNVLKIKQQLLLKMAESLIIYFAGEASGYRPSACPLDLSGS